MTMRERTTKTMRNSPTATDRWHIQLLVKQQLETGSGSAGERRVTIRDKGSCIGEWRSRGRVLGDEGVWGDNYRG